jgi:FkbM family methyltransferase
MSGHFDCRPALLRLKPRLLLRRLLRRLGYDLHSLPIDFLTLRDLGFDLCFLISNPRPVVIDVGANTGQTIDLLRSTLDKPCIFSFEPNPALAASLRQKYADCGVVVEPMAVGSSEGTSAFNVLENHELSSILELQRHDENPFSDTAIRQTIRVPVTTVDCYAAKHALTHIDLLKIDTQGFDLEVLRGAAEMLRRCAVGTLLIEVNFISLYEGQASFGDIERFLAEKGYGLLALYEVNRPNSCLRWATACFRRIVQ